MLYAGYLLNRRANASVVAASRLTARALQALPPALAGRPGVRHVWAACEVLSKARPSHWRPSFAIDSVGTGEDQVAVVEQATRSTPFATLIHFTKATGSDQPRVLVVGPLSGHFTTLIRPTIRTLLAEHDVHVLDWHNARQIPVRDGAFGLDDYIEHVMETLRFLGPDTHVVAVCQPAVPVLAAVALLAAADDPAQPVSLTLIAGPIDTRINPNRVNTLATTKPLSYFEKRAIATVPRRYPGAGRRVYPGFLQLAAFMSLDPKRHLAAHLGLYRNLAAGNTAEAAVTQSFYQEYGAVMDVPAEFYLDTVGRIFQQHLLARGALRWRDQAVDPAAITRTALLTVEGENDEICSPGQTQAAHALCSQIPDRRKRHHLQPGVGHYGIFGGSRWEAEVYPVVRDFIRASAATDRAPAQATAAP